jgi:gamma-glutamyl:cysteine ligase YbdK (ATP-grasp superfamily)
MGQFVDQTSFEQRDYTRFRRELNVETTLLHDLVESDALSRHPPMAGLELEAWLVDAAGRASPCNQAFIDRLGSSKVVAEIGRFSIELNLPPRPVHGDGLALLGADLQAQWQRWHHLAAEMGLQVVAIGILPTIADADLNVANLSSQARFRALNQQVQRLRHGRPNRLDIDGMHGEHLHSEHHDVMLEAAATSLQVHLQLPDKDTVRAYNAAIIASAATVALSGNSPLLFGKRLWQETRIPLFEQAMNIGAREDGSHAALSRVGFGSGYAGYSLLECYRENLERFDPLLPVPLDEPTERLAHLRLHNGTVWRWNRPIVGFDEDGRVHLRTEHRPMSAGPSVPDMMAHLGFVIGLVATLVAEDEPPEQRLPFDIAQRNFYRAAREGLDTSLQWVDGRVLPAHALLLELLPRAHDGLRRMGVDAALADGWMMLLEARLAARITGARWQLARLDALGGDLTAMTLEYARHQAEGAPVHLWR